MSTASNDPNAAHRRTTLQWWEQTKSDPQRLLAWLGDQYRGEATASTRIMQLRERFAPPGSRASRILKVIAGQERLHAAWVGQLLRARGVEPEVETKAERYWPRVLEGIEDLSTGCAVGAHAERMRLERIEVIADDPHAPADVRRVFARILVQERFHERAFSGLSDPQALEATRGAHELGRVALGLHP